MAFTTQNPRNIQNLDSEGYQEYHTGGAAAVFVAVLAVSRPYGSFGDHGDALGAHAHGCIDQYGLGTARAVTRLAPTSLPLRPCDRVRQNTYAAEFLRLLFVSFLTATSEPV